MMIRRCVALICVLLAGPVAADTAADKKAAAIRGLTAPDGTVRTLEQAMADRGLAGLSVAVVEDGEIAWTGTWGVRSLRTGEPVDDETVFNLASISKPITALVAAILAEKGLIDLNLPVARYLERWTLPDNELTRAAPISLFHLFSHTAGTSQHGFRDFYLDQPLPTLVEVLEGGDLPGTAPITVNFEPGTNWRYSGGGYVIAQIAIEDHLGRSLADLAAEHLFEPLGLANTTMRQHGEPGFPTNVARAHDANGEQVGPTGLPICPQLSASGVWSTPRDMARLVIAMQRALAGHDGGVISPAVARLTTDIVTTKVMGGWSVGWARGHYHGNRDWFWHGGANTGTGGHVYGSMDGGVGLVILGNGPNSVREPLLAELRESILTSHGWRQPLPAPEPALAVAPGFATQVVGRYRTLWGSEIRVTVRDGGLSVHGLLGSGPVDLVKVADNAFLVDGFKSRISFLTNPDDGREHMALQRHGTDEIVYEVAALAAPAVMPAEHLQRGDHEAALAGYRHLLAAHPDDPAASERTINALGYRELGDGRIDQALLAFQIYVELYPESANAYDSLGEGYMEAGDTERAIANYERSLELNPANGNAVRMLERLRER